MWSEIPNFFFPLLRHKRDIITCHWLVVNSAALFDTTHLTLTSVSGTWLELLFFLLFHSMFVQGSLFGCMEASSHLNKSRSNSGQLFFWFSRRSFSFSWLHLMDVLINNLVKFLLVYNLVILLIVLITINSFYLFLNIRLKVLFLKLFPSISISSYSP